jgi:holin-like protein
VLGALAILLVCQLAGEVLARGLALPVPGPVLGLLLLSVGLLLFVRYRSGLAETELTRLSAAMLGSLGLLFVPAGAGVINQLGLLGAYWLPIVVVIVVSTVVTMLATVGTFLAVKHLLARR